MEIKFRSIPRFQEGGPMPEPGTEGGAPGGAPVEGGAPEGAAPEGGEDPLMQLADMAMQALQSQDCQAMAQVCDTFLQLIQQAQGGGGAPEPEGEPVYRKGGVLVRRIKK